MLPDLRFEGVEIHDEGIRYCEFSDAGFQGRIHHLLVRQAFPAGVIANRHLRRNENPRQEAPSRASGVISSIP